MGAGTERGRRVDAGLLLCSVPVIWGVTFPAGKRALEVLPLLPFVAWSRLLGVALSVGAMVTSELGTRRAAEIRLEPGSAV